MEDHLGHRSHGRTVAVVSARLFIHIEREYTSVEIAVDSIVAVADADEYKKQTYIYVVGGAVFTAKESKAHFLHRLEMLR